MIDKFIVVEKDQIQVMIHLVDRWHFQICFLDVISTPMCLQMCQNFVKDAEAKIGGPMDKIN